MYRTASNAYQNSSANTVEDKPQILIKLYNGAIRFMHLAKKGIEDNRAKVRGESISKAMAIIAELDASLDMEKGGQMARNLGGLYQYAMNRLALANLHNDSPALSEVINILTTLKEGFEGAICQQQPRKAAVPPEYQQTGKREEVRFAV